MILAEDRQKERRALNRKVIRVQNLSIGEGIPKGEINQGGSQREKYQDKEDASEEIPVHRPRPPFTILFVVYHRTGKSASCSKLSKAEALSCQGGGSMIK